MVNQVRGFTIIELLMTVAIISILSAGAIIGFERILTGMRLGQQRDYLLAFLQEAKALSITSYPHGVRFNASTMDILRLDGDNGNFEYNTGETFTVQKSSVALPSGYAVTLNRCTNDNIIWFDRKGIPRCSDWTYAMTTILVKNSSSISDATCKGTDGNALTADDDRRCKAVVIDVAGRIKYEK